MTTEQHHLSIYTEHTPYVYSLYRIVARFGFRDDEHNYTI